MFMNVYILRLYCGRAAFLAADRPSKQVLSWTINTIQCTILLMFLVKQLFAIKLSGTNQLKFCAHILWGHLEVEGAEEWQ